MKVYVVYNEYVDDGDISVSIIGVYTSEQVARKAMVDAWENINVNYYDKSYKTKNYLMACKDKFYNTDHDLMQVVKLELE